MSYVLQQKHHTYINYDVNRLANVWVLNSDIWLLALSLQYLNQSLVGSCFWKVFLDGVLGTLCPKQPFNFSRVRTWENGIAGMHGMEENRVNLSRVINLPTLQIDDFLHIWPQNIWLLTLSLPDLNPSLVGSCSWKTCKEDKKIER